jgi:hypothetical protein
MLWYVWVKTTPLVLRRFRESLFRSVPLVDSFQFVCSEVREDAISSKLLKMCPGLTDRLLAASKEEVDFIADLGRVSLHVAELGLLTSD